MREAERIGHYSPEAGHEAARRAVDRELERLRAAGVTDVEGRVEDGDDASEIVHAAETGPFDLVVVGTGDEDWLDLVPLGSVSSSVVSASPCPVLVVHQAPEPDREVRVLVGADGSDGARRAIDAFIALAASSRCTVTVVAAASPLAEPGGEAPGAAEVAGGGMVLAHRHAEAAADALGDAGFRVETEVVPGRPAEVLLDRVRQRDADLVVVGARGQGRFQAKVLGSVSDRVVHTARATIIGR
jgi:nucleotide-binding universal stress UspA family protein